MNQCWHQTATLIDTLGLGDMDCLEVYQCDSCGTLSFMNNDRVIPANKIEPAVFRLIEQRKRNGKAVA